MMNEACHISLRPLETRQTHPGYRDSDFKRLFGTLTLAPQLPFSRSEFFRAGRETVSGQSISGVQEKLSLAIINRQLHPVSQGGQFILKPSPEAFPHAAENEHAAMKLSELLGFETAPCGLIAFADGELAYICQRFDRGPKGERYPQEDLLQLAGLPTRDKYRLSYQQAGQTILKATGGKRAPALELIRRVMLAYLMGNDDLHLKNLSLRRNNPRAQTPHYDTLTPNYDLLFCQALDGADQRDFLALDLLDNDEFTETFERLGFYSRADFIELGRRLGIHRRAIDTQIEKLAQREQAAVTLIERSLMPAPMRTAAIELFQGRMKALQIE